MTVDVDFTWLVESSSIDVHAGNPVTVDQLLRRLDVLRQRLAVRWCGAAGAFAGYDELQIPNRGVVTSGTVRLEARMVEAGEKSHIVDFRAVLRPAAAAPEEVHPTVIARGRGRTLQVEVQKVLSDDVSGCLV